VNTRKKKPARHFWFTLIVNQQAVRRLVEIGLKGEEMRHRTEKGE
jgi:hypothetical protein